MPRKQLSAPPAFSKTYTSWDTVPIVIGLPELCCILRKTDETVRKMLASGEIPSRKSGGAWYIDKENLRSYLSGGEQHT